MPHRPAFVPRSHLENGKDFGIDRDAMWNFASSFEDAIELARAREQHELACSINELRENGKNSIHDIAEELGETEDTFWRKLTGRAPAQEEDLIVWSWLTGENRRTYSPKDLAGDGSIWLPMWPIPRFRVKRRS
jgi:hypothetical protein